MAIGGAKKKLEGKAGGGEEQDAEMASRWRPVKPVTEEQGQASARRLHSWYDEAQHRREVKREARQEEAVKGLTFKPVLATTTKAGAKSAAVSGSGGEGFGNRLYDDG